MSTDVVDAYRSGPGAGDPFADVLPAPPSQPRDLGPACRKCDRPESLHCPGCTACWPDHACGLDCDGDPVEIAAVVVAIERWEAARTVTGTSS